ncbi:nucleotidyltransferase domain-containing protein [Micromonospora sp. NBRC 101691]|uniref:nucleotidyltransferase domain-containing protein n=1 Tax=Micromonospora sp. NBRC 101691 TaxID=3032198 RepID=UPI0024A59355|nr:nucleotidyltransferase domain-containing protein [Micromonospora sp. NBRC 101691]GLY25024.1 hypothetical protein Misp04_47560 [Micromonospora sp. NBRC 101691]
MSHDTATRVAVDELTASIVTALGTGLRSVILHGSLATGDFRPGRSDVDVLAVVADGLTDRQADNLEEVVRRARLGDATGVDLHVVTADVAGTPTRNPPLELHVGRYDHTSVGVEVARRVPADPDLPAEFSTARAHGRSQYGAGAGEVLGPVPPGWLHERGRHWLTTWRSLTDDVENATFMVFTAARIWRFAVEGTHCGKTRAAHWALARDPSLTVLREALHHDEVDPAAPVGEEGMLRLFDTVLRQIAPPR